VSRGISSDRAITNVFDYHINKRRDSLNEARMRSLLESIRRDIGNYEVDSNNNDINNHTRKLDSTLYLFNFDDNNTKDDHLPLDRIDSFKTSIAWNIHSINSISKPSNDKNLATSASATKDESTKSILKKRNSLGLSVGGKVEEEIKSIVENQRRSSIETSKTDQRRSSIETSKTDQRRSSVETSKTDQRRSSVETNKSDVKITQNVVDKEEDNDFDDDDDIMSSNDQLLSTNKKP
jgi:hypothetical protein